MILYQKYALAMSVSIHYLRLYVPFLSNDSQAKANYAALSGPYSTSYPIQWSIGLHVLNLEDNYLGNHNLGECDPGKNCYPIRPCLDSCDLAYLFTHTLYPMAYNRKRCHTLQQLTAPTRL
jgi:hypothetical protein